MLEQIIKSGLSESPVTVDAIHIENSFTSETKGRINTEATFSFNISDNKKNLFVSLNLKIYVIPEGTETPIQLANLKSHCSFETTAEFSSAIATNETDTSFFGFPLLQRSAQILDTTFRLMNLSIPIPMCQRPNIQSASNS